MGFNQYAHKLNRYEFARSRHVSHLPDTRLLHCQFHNFSTIIRFYCDPKPLRFLHKGRQIVCVCSLFLHSNSCQALRCLLASEQERGSHRQEVFQQSEFRACRRIVCNCTLTKELSSTRIQNFLTLESFAIASRKEF